MPDESQFLALIQAQQQRAKGQSGSASFAPAANDRVHGLGNFQLQPVLASIGNVPAVGALRDNSLQAVLFCQREQLFPVLQLMIGVANPFGRIKQTLQELLALEERRFAKVVSVAIEKIKSEVDGRYLRGQMLAGRAHVHAFLQASEIAAALCVQSDNLPVKNRVMSGQRTGKRSH